MEGLGKTAPNQSDNSAPEELTNQWSHLLGIRNVDIEAGASSLTFTWTEQGVRLTLEGIREDGRGITAEVSGSSTKQDRSRPSTPTKIDLLTYSQRKTAANYLQESLPLRPDGKWKELLDDACFLAIRYMRQDEPIIRLTRQPTIVPPQFRLAPLVYERLPTIMFTGPGVAKSYVGLFVSMVVQAGANLGALSGSQGETLYLDFESDEDDFRYRAECIRRGNPNLGTAEPYYLRCYRPLADCVTSIRRHCERTNYKFIVVDSLGPACGQDLDRAETALQFFEALRSLRIAALVVAHQPKAQERGKGTSIFGSTFFNAMARSSWELQKQESANRDEIRLSLVHRKANLSRLLDPIGLVLTFGDHSARFETIDDESGAGVSPTASIPQRIQQALAEKPHRAAELADRLGLRLDKVKPRLSDLKRSGLVRSIGGGLWMKVEDKQAVPRRTRSEPLPEPVTLPNS